MSRNSEILNIVLGVLLLLGLHVAAFCGFFVLLFLLSALYSYLPNPIINYLISNYRFLIWLASPGLTQLIYVIPIVFWLKRQRRWGLMKGIIIGAVLTALLNGGCWLLLASQS